MNNLDKGIYNFIASCFSQFVSIMMIASFAADDKIVYLVLFLINQIFAIINFIIGSKFRKKWKMSLLSIDKQILEKYDWWYRERILPPSMTTMCWGLEIGKGWYYLVDKLSYDIMKVIKNKYKWYKWSIRLLIGKLEIPIHYKWQKLVLLLSKVSFICWKDVYPRAAQVKQKYGSLRYYAKGSTRKIDKLIDEAENYSAHTCESCGKFGVEGFAHNIDHWVYCICDECKNKIFTEDDPDDVV